MNKDAYVDYTWNWLPQPLSPLFHPLPRLSLILWPVTIQLANSPTGCSSVTYHPSTHHLFRRLFDSLFWRPFSLCHWCLSSWTHSEQLPVWAHLAHGKQCIGKGNWRSNSVSRRTTRTYHILIYTSILLSQLQPYPTQPYPPTSPDLAWSISAQLIMDTIGRNQSDNWKLARCENGSARKEGTAGKGVRS